MTDMLNTLNANWELIMASMVALLAAADKILMVIITSLGNIRDTWRRTFPKGD